MPTNVFDLEEFKNQPDPAPPTRMSRTAVREGMTEGEKIKGRKRLYDMVELAFNKLQEVVEDPEATNMDKIRASTALLDRAGFGPKSTMDINTTHTDLSRLSETELAERAAKLSDRLMKKVAASASS